MALTEIKTSGIADDAVTTDKLANAINTARDANTAKASITINNNADNRVITGSGTAGTLEGESNLTFSGSALGVTGTTAITGNTSVGTTTQNWRFQAFGGRSTFTDTSTYALGIRKNSAQDADHNFWLGGAAADDDTHPDLVFSDNGGSEKFRFRQSGGLCFNGDSAAANALDDYEEGTWTPVWSDASSGGTAATTNQAHGRYTKIGRVVHLHFYTWSIQSQGTSNAMFLQGLPFAAIGGFSFIGSVGGRYWNQGDDNQYNLQLRINANNSYGNLEWAESHAGDGVAATFDGIVNAYTNFTSTITYLTDS